MPVVPYAEWHNWYSHRRWRKRYQLRIEPLCRLCAAAGLTTPASIADHIEPHRGDRNAFWLGELQIYAIAATTPTNADPSAAAISRASASNGKPILEEESEHA